MAEQEQAIVEGGKPARLYPGAADLLNKDERNGALIDFSNGEHLYIAPVRSVVIYTYPEGSKLMITHGQKGQEDIEIIPYKQVTRVGFLSFSG